MKICLSDLILKTIAAISGLPTILQFLASSRSNWDEFPSLYKYEVELLC